MSYGVVISSLLQYLLFFLVLPETAYPTKSNGEVSADCSFRYNNCKWQIKNIQSSWQDDHPILREVEEQKDKAEILAHAKTKFGSHHIRPTPVQDQRHYPYRGRDDSAGTDREPLQRKYSSSSPERLLLSSQELWQRIKEGTYGHPLGHSR